MALLGYSISMEHLLAIFKRIFLVGCDIVVDTLYVHLAVLWCWSGICGIESYVDYLPKVEGGLCG